MPEVSADQFPELGTKIPTSPVPESNPYFTKGGQGKFFQDPKPEPQHRWPRGYTPERMREVREAPLDIAIMPKQTQAATVKTPQGARGVRRVQQMIARGTTPMSDFDPRAGKQGYTREPLKIKFGRKLPYGVGGWYQTRVKNVRRQEGEQTVHGQKVTREIHIKADPGALISEVGSGGSAAPYYPAVHHEEISQSLHHELGHYRSQEVSGFYSGYRSPSEKGKEEAYADVNMLSRTRADPRNVRRGTTGEPWLGYERKTDPFFHASYQKYRKELGGPLGIPTDISTQRQIEKSRRNLAEHKAEMAKLHLNNDQFFHRDYAEESRTGKPAWQVNPRHVPQG